MKNVIMPYKKIKTVETILLSKKKVQNLGVKKNSRSNNFYN